LGFIREYLAELIPNLNVFDTLPIWQNGANVLKLMPRAVFGHQRETTVVLQDKCLTPFYLSQSIPRRNLTVCACPALSFYIPSISVPRCPCLRLSVSMSESDCDSTVCLRVCACTRVNKCVCMCARARLCVRVFICMCMVIFKS
jgi:hypothetical protein